MILGLRNHYILFCPAGLYINWTLGCCTAYVQHSLFTCSKALDLYVYHSDIGSISARLHFHMNLAVIVWYHQIKTWQHWNLSCAHSVEPTCILLIDYSAISIDIR